MRKNLLNATVNDQNLLKDIYKLFACSRLLMLGFCQRMQYIIVINFYFVLTSSLVTCPGQDKHTTAKTDVD